MKRRMLSLILAIVMVVGMLPTTVFAAESGDTPAAEITGVSVTVDGVTYTEGNVTITPTSTVIFTVTGTNFANASADNFLRYAPNAGDTLNSNWWTMDIETNTATMDCSDLISSFASCENYEVRYSNDGQSTWVNTGIYLTYDNSIAEEDKIQITGVSIQADGEIKSGHVTVTYDSNVYLIVNGTNLENLSDAYYFDLPYMSGMFPASKTIPMTM